jgi:hypothetical protein
MIDPKEKQEDEQPKEQTADNTQNENSETNWSEHQQVDEIGNELDPDDIK